MTLDEIQARLANITGRVRKEEDLQKAVAYLLPKLHREHRLTPSLRIDFFDEESSIGVECKVSGSAIGIQRQLMSYEKHCPGGLVLVTTKLVDIGVSFDIPFKQIVTSFRQ